jgi:hypothetical protein
MLLRLRPAAALLISAALAGCIAAPSSDPASSAKPPVYDNRMPSQMPNPNIYSPRTEAPAPLPAAGNAPPVYAQTVSARGGTGGPLVAGPGYPDGVPPHIMAGAWRLSDGARICLVSLTQEHAGRGYSAQGQQGCSEEFFGLRSWEMRDNELVLRNNMGEVAARLYPVAANRFDGKSSRGIPVLLAR